MMPRARLALVTVAVGLAAVWPTVEILTTGTPAALLGPGELNPSHPFVVSEVPELPSAPGLSGHDGQQLYVIARHLTSPEAGAEFLNEPLYRYRRIVYPAVAALLAPGAAWLWCGRSSSCRSRA